MALLFIFQELHSVHGVLIIISPQLLISARPQLLLPIGKILDKLIVHRVRSREWLLGFVVAPGDFAKQLAPLHGAGRIGHPPSLSYVFPQDFFGVLVLFRVLDRLLERRPSPLGDVFFTPGCGGLPRAIRSIRIGVKD